MINAYVANRKQALEALVMQLRSVGIKPTKDKLKSKVLQILGGTSVVNLPSKQPQTRKVKEIPDISTLS